MDQNQKIQDYIDNMIGLKNTLPAFGFVVFSDEETKKLFCEKIDTKIIDLKNPNPAETIRELYNTISETDVLYISIGSQINPSVYSQLFSIYNGRFDGWVSGAKDRVYLDNLPAKKLIFFITKNDLNNPVYEKFNTSVCRIE